MHGAAAKFAHSESPSYVLLTPAKNESKYIDKTLGAVTSQTVLPRLWVIVSDGSTDGTDDIVKSYETDHPFIKLARREAGSQRNFGGKVHAIRYGLEQLGHIHYDFIGNLDADISFEPDYYERVMKRMDAEPGLGIGGGVLYDHMKGKWVPQNTNVQWSVGGPIQLFRKKCFEDIGGYVPLPRGGIDGVAEVMSRMKGWHVRSFEEIPVWHHRPVSAERGRLLLPFWQGVIEYSLAYHWLFWSAKTLSRFFTPPYILGGLLRICGFLWAAFKREPCGLPPRVIAYQKREQLQRLFKFFPKDRHVDKE